MKVYTIYLNEEKHAEEIRQIELAMKLSPESRSKFGMLALLKEAKRIITAKKRRRE